MAYALPCPPLGQPDLRGKAAPALSTSHLTKLSKVAAAPVVPASPVQSQKIVSLFGSQNDFHDDPDAVPPSWLSAFQLIRDVGAQVRIERDRAQGIIQHSQSLIQGTIAQVREAELRAEVAATTAAIAVLRADRAEVRARLAEERAQQAEDRAIAAQVSEKEAQLWLRRLHAQLNSETDGLMIVPKQPTTVKTQAA